MRYHHKAFAAVLLALLALWGTGAAEILPVLYESSITAVSGEAPLQTTVSVTTDATVRGIRVLDDRGTELLGSISAGLDGQNRRNYRVGLTFTQAFDGELTVYLKTGGNQWVATDAVFRLRVTAPTATPTPRPAPTPTPVPTATPAPAIPWDTTAFTLRNAGTVDDSDERIQARSGPDTSYAGGGAFKTRKIASIQALYLENVSGSNWVYAELRYTTGYHRRVYFRPNVLHLPGDLPYMNFTSYPGTVTQDLTPLFGPAQDFDPYKDAAVGAGTAVSILHEENGYLFVEYRCGVGLVRAWMPKGVVRAE